MKYNKITLSFSENDESLFRKEYFLNSLFQVRLAFVSLIILYGAFGYLDSLIVPEFATTFHIIRFFIVVPVLTLTFALTFFSIFQKVWQELMLLCVIIGGTGISIMTMLAPEIFVYNAGMMLVFFASYFFIKLRFFLATIAGWSVLLIYNIGAIYYAENSLVLLITNNFFFVSANFIGMFAAYNVEYYERRNYFLHQTLLESNIFLDKIIDAVPDPLFVKDKDHKWIILNKTFSDFLGLSKEELLNKSDYDLFPKEQADIFWKTDNLVFETRMDNINEENITNHLGERRIISTKKKIIQNESTGEKILVGIIRDITELKNTEKTLIENHEKLEELNATKDRFISILAHDLKNPFSSLIGFSELLIRHLDSLDKEQIRKYATNLYETTKNINDFLEELLAWARTQQSEISFQPKKLKLSAIVSDCKGLLSNGAQAKNINIIDSISSEIYIVADVGMVKTILRNLLTNAIKFTPKEGAIQVFAKVNHPMIEIMISDTGIGIEEESIKTLFKIGGAKSRVGTEGERGTGFGLLLCKEFVDKHGGHIWVESEKGKGSTFYFTMPIF